MSTFSTALGTKTRLGLKKKSILKKRPTPAPVVVVAPPPPPPPPPIVNTPAHLVDKWLAKLPWLGQIERGEIIDRWDDHSVSTYLIPVVNAYEYVTYAGYSKGKMAGDKDTAQLQVGQSFSNNSPFGLYSIYSHPIKNKTTIPFTEIVRLNKSADPRTTMFAIASGMFELQFGCDPEFFSLTNPPKIKTNKDYCGSLDPDGLAWECHPASARCFEVLWGHFRDAHQYRTELQLTTQARLAIADLKTPPAPDLLELGCTPSENVYGMVGDMHTASTRPYRWAGGHIHCNLPPMHVNPETIRRCIKNLDLIHGPALVSMVGLRDDAERRKYYGLAGEFRTKPYGFEYRTPSNQMWGNSYIYYASMEIFRMVVKLTLMGLDGMDLGWYGNQEESVACIQQNNVEMARAIVKRNAALYWALFDCKINFDSGNKSPLGLILQEDDAIKTASAIHAGLIACTALNRRISGLTIGSTYTKQLEVLIADSI